MLNLLLAHTVYCPLAGRLLAPFAHTADQPPWLRYIKAAVDPLAVTLRGIDPWLTLTCDFLCILLDRTFFRSEAIFAHFTVSHRHW